MVHFFHWWMFVSYLLPFFLYLEYIQRNMTEDKHQQILMSNRGKTIYGYIQKKIKRCAWEFFVVFLHKTFIQ
jgi:hypothetical protein